MSAAAESGARLMRAPLMGAHQGVSSQNCFSTVVSGRLI